MASVCHRCALRLQRTAQVDLRNVSKRTFGSTSTRSRGALPAFHESSNAELDNILATFREKHLVPAYLHKQERRLIFGQKYKQQLEDNPQSTLIGDEEIDLNWLERRADIPNRAKLLTRAINLILDGDSKAWENLPKLLQGLRDGIKKPLTNNQLEKIVRRASQNDKIGIVIQCLRQAHNTGLSLKNEAVLRSVLVALRELPQRKEWSKAAMEKALRDANVVAQLLENEEHGSGRRLAEDDPRTRPEVLGLFLELAAVYTSKYEDGKDAQGLVKAYARRLTSQLEQKGTQPQNLRLEVKSRQWPMLTAIPVWHSLVVAQKVLGKEMPNADIAQQTISMYESVLSELAAELEARRSDASYYDQEALSAWNTCKEP